MMTPMIDNKDIEKIVLAYLLKVRQLEEHTCVVLKERSEHLMTRVLLRMNQNLKNMNQVKKYDGLYYLTEDMKQDYESFLEGFNEGSDLISDPMVQEIFGGISEMALASLANMPSKSDNPITYERMVLISAGILRVKQYYLTAMDSELPTCSLGEDISSERIIGTISQQLKLFFEKTMEGVLSILNETLTLLADFSEGKKYQKFVEEQVANLWTLVVTQKEVILVHLATEAETVLVTELLDRLTHIHDVSEEALRNLISDEDSVDGSSSIIDIEQVEEIMTSHVLNEVKSIEALLKDGKLFRDSSISQLKGIIESHVNDRSHAVSTYIVRESAEFQLLSVQMVTLFSETVLGLKTTTETYETNQGKAIVKGIKETMDLKLESFREKDTEYRLGMKHLFMELEQIMKEQKQEMMDSSDRLLMAIVAGNEEALPKIERQLNDQLDRVKERQLMYDINYLSNELLFELKTYEELIEHSLRKLIELEPDKAKEMTEILLGTLERSRVILSTHRIELIIPKPHDKFIGKYHEVMLAEKEEGFVQGEVVKTINSGYQLKNHVILRACVLAAR